MGFLAFLIGFAFLLGLCSVNILLFQKKDGHRIFTVRIQFRVFFETEILPPFTFLMAVYSKSLQLSPQQAEPMWMQMILFVELQIIFLETRNPKNTSFSQKSLLREEIHK